MPIVVEGTFSPSPSARSCTSLKTDVASYVGAPGSSTALSKAEDCLRAAVARLNTYNWAWSIAYQDITLVAGTGDYDLASQVAAPRKAELLDSNSKAVSVIGYVDPKTFSLTYYDRSGSGSPDAYTIENPYEYGQLRLSIAPSAGFISSYPTLRFWMYKKVVPCGGSTTSLDVPFEVAEWIAWQAKAYMAAHYDLEKVSIAQSIAEQHWISLIRQNTRNQLTDWY